MDCIHQAQDVCKGRSRIHPALALLPTGSIVLRLRVGHVAASFEYGNEACSFINDGKFLE
jgi:hypothetical protein